MENITTEIHLTCNKVIFCQPPSYSNLSSMVLFETYEVISPHIQVMCNNLFFYSLNKENHFKCCIRHPYPEFSFTMSLPLTCNLSIKDIGKEVEQGLTGTIHDTLVNAIYQPSCPSRWPRQRDRQIYLFFIKIYFPLVRQSVFALQYVHRQIYFTIL